MGVGGFDFRGALGGGGGIDFTVNEKMHHRHSLNSICIK